MGHLHALEMLIKRHWREVLELLDAATRELDGLLEASDAITTDELRALRNPVRAQMRKGQITSRQYEAELYKLKSRLELRASCVGLLWGKVECEIGNRFGVCLHYGKTKKVVEVANDLFGGR